MKLLKIKPLYKGITACVFFSLIISLTGNAAEIDDRLARCARINDDTARLKCFDDLAPKQITVNEEVIANPAEKTFPQESANLIEKTAPRIPAVEEKYFSVMEKHWDMSPDHRKRNIFVLTPYRPNYFLPLAYNSSPNKEASLDFDPDAKAQCNEVKFQLSFKFKIWEDLFQGVLKDKIKESTGIRGVDVWAAYTQQSFWQLYNSVFSSPFRETNYEPELLLNLRMQYDIPGLTDTKLQFINVGFNHQSNGRSEPLSRSWNRIVANAGLEKANIFGSENGGVFGLLLKTWYRLPEDETDDDNPYLSRYAGYGELWGTLHWKNQRVAVMLRNNLRSENRGALQLDWSFPLPWIGNRVSGYLQYFNGYGESLLDYDKSVNRISAGFMLVDWK